MPITRRALTQSRRDFARAWERVNDQFQQVRDARDHAWASDERHSLTVWRVLLTEYRRVRALLYGLLPEIEERDG